MLRILLISSVAFLVIMFIFKPRQLKALGRKARLVGLVYVAAILISAALDIFVGWRT